MSLLHRLLRRPQARPIVDIVFLSEQDGPSERDLKAALLPSLRSAGVLRAYLAQARLSQSATPDIVLCLAAPTNPSLVRDIQSVFASLFRSKQHLDALFLSNETQESSLASVCQPFFVAEPHGCAEPASGTPQ